MFLRIFMNLYDIKNYFLLSRWPSLMDNKGKEIEIKKIFLVLKQRAWIIIVMTVLCTVAGASYNEKIKPIPIYEASSRIIIHENSNLINTLIVFFKEPQVLERVVEELDLSISPEALSHQISVQNVGESQILRVSVTNRTHETAVNIVNTLNRVYINAVRDILDFESVEVLSEAKSLENPSPINPAS